MLVSDMMEKLQHFPQDAEVLYTGRNIAVYLYNYKLPDEDYVPSFILEDVDVTTLPWIIDPTWLGKRSRKTYTNYYFKDFGDGRTYIGGMQIPKDTDGVCRRIKFVNCKFHTGCNVKYEDCEFIDCDGKPQK